VSEPRLTSAELSANDQARIREDVRAGNAVIAPQRGVVSQGTATIGWWRIDPRTGQTLGIGRNGWERQHPNT
jgi:hypothetical protein